MSVRNGGPPIEAVHQPLHALPFAVRPSVERTDSISRHAFAVPRSHTSDTHRAVRRVHAGFAALYEARGERDSAAVYRRLAEVEPPLDRGTR